MPSSAWTYLSDLRKHLHLDSDDEREILQELRDHIEDRTREIESEDVPTAEAQSRALEELGGSHDIAEELYRVHTRASWHHTALAVLPHVALAMIFALHLWTSPGWIALLLAGVVIMSAVGWRKGRPKWTYSWLGYSLAAPFVSWGLAMTAVVYGAWSVLTRGALPLSIPLYLVIFGYVAVSIWIVVRVASKLVRPDWVMGSLTILPVPFLAYWFVYFYDRRELLESSGYPLREADGSAAVVFLVLAGTTALFLRISRRVVRVALLAVAAPSLIVLAWISLQGGPGFVALFLFCAFSMLVLLAPKLFDSRAASSRESAPVLEDLG
jgi:hypothetical protein